MKDIALGVRKMHSLNPIIAHLDLKPLNILINDHKFILADFGTAQEVKDRIIGQGYKGGWTQMMSWQYSSPERIDC